MEQNTNHSSGNRPAITPEMLARIGGGEIAYVRPIMSEVFKKLFPQAPDMEPGIRLFMLSAADGTPILLTDTEESALASAREHELRTVAVH
jgi:hypothetical protein